VDRRVIVDANVALKWVLPEDDSPRAARLLEAELHAPDFVLIECCNCLRRASRQGLLAAEDAKAVFDFLGRTGIVLSSSARLLPAALDLAQALDHPAYDCLYLALALETDLPLVTADAGLIRAAGRDPSLRGKVAALRD